MAFVTQTDVLHRQLLHARGKLVVLRTFTLLEARNRGNVWAQTTELTGVSREVIRNILDEFERTGAVGAPTPAAPPKSHHLENVSARVQVAVRRFVVDRQANDQITYTTDVQKDVFHEQFGVDVSVSTVRRVMLDLGLEAVNEDGIGDESEWREKFYVRLDRWNMLSAVADANLFRQMVVYHDETFVYQHSTKHHLTWVDPHMRHKLASGGRRWNVMGAITDSGKVLVDCFVICERWRFVEERGAGKRLVLMPLYVRQVGGSVAQPRRPNPVAAAVETPADDPRDDLVDFFERYIERPGGVPGQKQKRARHAHVTFTDVAMAHLEYCVWCKIVPISEDDLRVQLAEHNLFNESGDLIDNIVLKRTVKLHEVALMPDVQIPEFVTEDDLLIACVFCDVPLACDAKIDWICCAECAQRGGRVFGIKFAPNDGDKPGDTHKASDRPTSPVSEPEEADPGEQSVSTTEANAYFTGEFVEHWFETCLVPVLHDEHIANALVVFDLASIHLRLSNGTTISDLKKTRKTAAEYLTAKGVNVPKQWTKAIVVAKALDVVAKEMTFLQVLAARAGHTLVYFPAHHPGLNPIEYLWAFVKRKVAISRSKGQTFDDVASEIRSQLSQVPTETVQHMVSKVKQDERYYKQLEVQVLQQQDRESEKEYRAELARWEAGVVAEGAHKPNPPKTMPLSFRGSLNWRKGV